MLQQIASAHAHSILAELLRLGILAPANELVVSAKSDEDEIKVIVSISRHQPATIHPSVLAKIDAIAAKRKALTPVEECILDAAPAKKFVTIDRLAKLAGYSNSQWFRERVDELILAHLLIRTSKGIQRAA